MITCFLVDYFFKARVCSTDMCGPSGHLCLVDAPSVYGEFTLYNEDMSVYGEFTLYIGLR
jgi:hypothetical protein